MIAEKIFEWAKRTPENTAVIQDGRHWSYHSFGARISAARKYFQSQDVSAPGYAVMVVRDLLDNWIFSLALRSLGLDTIAVPNLASVDEIGLPGVRYLVMSKAEAEKWTLDDQFCVARGLKLLSVSFQNEPETLLDLPATSTPTGGNILRTSGTTGVYKNVLMTPAIDKFWLERNAKLLGFNQATVFGVFNFPMWTAAGYRLTSNPWTVGGASVIAQGSEMLPTLLTQGLSHLFMIPMKLAQALALPESSFARNDSLQLIISSGAVTRPQIRQAKARITPRLFNLLSSTESGVIGLTPLEESGDPRAHMLATDRVVEIVDEAENQLPAGETGQLRISTVGGPTGYVGDEVATKAFFKNGFFYPGDLAAIQADGRLVLQGRFTSVINLGGNKISTEPLEDKLSEIPGISGACLITMEDDKGVEHYHLAIECEVPTNPARIRTELSENFPKLPLTHIHYFRTLRRNAMGKIMRQAVQDQIVAQQLFATGRGSREN